MSSRAMSPAVDLYVASIIICTQNLICYFLLAQN
jgi:hypothetical protein